MDGGARRKKGIFYNMKIRMTRNAAFALNFIFFNGRRRGVRDPGFHRSSRKPGETYRRIEEADGFA